jgi:hypothetical protein
MQFVETRRGASEPVVTAGEISYVYQRYYERPWAKVENVAQLEALRKQERRVWLLYTFPLYIERKTPELLAAIRHACAMKQVFPGTVGGGDITVCRIDSQEERPGTTK